MYSNASNLFHSLEFLKKVLDVRLQHYFLLSEMEQEEEILIPPLAYYDDNSAFGEFIKSRHPSFEEYIILLLALAPHVQPNFLDQVIKEVMPESGNFPEIGGTKDKNGRYFLPTGETALFLLAGDDIDRRFEVQQIFTADHWFAQEQLLFLEPAEAGEPFFSGRIIMNPEFIELFTLGKVSTPSFSGSFPARKIETQLEWDDLVLSEEVIDQIREIREWVDFHHTLLQDWKMERKLKPGYRALFYGPPGTGKTLTATLLGKYTGREVFRVDLSTVVSKYIGETEKNLSNLFDKAQNKNWILFFDEADALFGKRTNVKSAHDRYANQEVSYLLQQVEDFPGLVILASNFKTNMDDAFLRRFNSIIKFPFPSFEERVLLWRKSFPPDIRFSDDLDLPLHAAQYELAGGNIINVVQYACLKAIAQHRKEISWAEVERGICREIEKEGKIFKRV